MTALPASFFHFPICRDAFPNYDKLMSPSKLFLRTLCTLFLLFLPLSGSEKKPNIIIFLVDDMGLMDTSVPFLTDESGNPKPYPLNSFYRTPHMEKLASRGMRFSDFYAQSVCSPSRASIMNGQNATRHRTTQWIRPTENNKGNFGPPKWNWQGFKEEDFTIAKHLKGAGYQTIHVGKAHFGPLGSLAEDPSKIGFSVNIGGASWGRPGSYYAAEKYGGLMNGKETTTHTVPHLEKYYETGEFLSEALTIEACGAIKTAVEAEKPFFLHMSHYAVHAPFNSDPRYAEHYKDSGEPDKVQAFATLIEGIDASLGEIMKTVEELGVAEETLLFFLGDNGTDAPIGKGTHHIGPAAPLRGKKATELEGGMRIPFISAWLKPNAGNAVQQSLPIKVNGTQTQLGTIMDLVPTIADVTETSLPAEHIIDGVSLKKQLSGTRNAEREETFLMHFPHQHRGSYFTSYRNGDWKVIYQYLPDVGKQSKERYRLFNLKTDLAEEKNLASERPKKLREMMQKMVTQLDAEGALYPVKNGKEVRPVIPE